MAVRPVKTQISLGIRPVWSESSLSAWRNLGSLATHWVHSEDSDQSRRMPRLWVFAGRTRTLLVLSCRGSYIAYKTSSLIIMSIKRVYMTKLDRTALLSSFMVMIQSLLETWKLWMTQCLCFLTDAAKSLCSIFAWQEHLCEKYTLAANIHIECHAKALWDSQCLIVSCSD